MVCLKVQSWHSSRDAEKTGYLLTLQRFEPDTSIAASLPLVPAYIFHCPYPNFKIDKGYVVRDL